MLRRGMGPGRAGPPMQHRSLARSQVAPSIEWWEGFGLGWVYLYDRYH